MTAATWSKRAQADYDRLKNYYRQIDEDLAAEIAERVIVKTYWLRDFPMTGSATGSGLSRKSNVAGTPYLIIYRPARDGVHILRLFHERQNWRR